MKASIEPELNTAAESSSKKSSSRWKSVLAALLLIVVIIAAFLAGYMPRQQRQAVLASETNTEARLIPAVSSGICSAPLGKQPKGGKQDEPPGAFGSNLSRALSVKPARRPPIPRSVLPNTVIVCIQ